MSRRRNSRTKIRRMKSNRGIPQNGRARPVSPKPKVKAASKIPLKRKSRAKPTREMRRSSGLLSEEADVFTEQAEELLSIYQTRNLDGPKKATTCHYDSPISRFKRDAYHFIRVTLKRQGGHNIIKSLVRRLEHDHKGPNFDANPFFSGLLAMDIERKCLDRRTLGHFARQMMYADQHEVPPCLLVGFLSQIGKSPTELARALAENQREPWKPEHKFLVIEAEPRSSRARS